jgi:CBS domain-containing protein
MPSTPLTLHVLQTELAAPNSGDWHVGLRDPARTVMTDFHVKAMVSVPHTMQVDEALELMKHAGVRSAFVVEAGRPVILGLVTAYDIMGEKPIRHIQQVGGSRDEVQVADVMDRAGGWELASMADVDRAHVSAVLDTFARIGRTHLAVVDQDPDPSKGPRLRGLFSAAKLLRLTERARREAKTG